MIGLHKYVKQWLRAILRSARQQLAPTKKAPERRGHSSTPDTASSEAPPVGDTITAGTVGAAAAAVGRAYAFYGCLGRGASD